MPELSRYPQDLTLVEEAVIAHAHPVISILKLRPAGSSLSTSYQRVCDYAVVLPQNLGLLLTLLPSSSLILHDVIQVIWAGKQPHTNVDISPFVYVKRSKILDALFWLKQNNALYKNIKVNYILLDNWDDEFILTGIKSRVLQCDPNLDKREGYAAELGINNHENELYHAMSYVGLNDLGLLSGCLYIDIDDS